MNYHELAFTDAVRRLQEQQGSRESYRKAAARSHREGLTDLEIEFIGQRDSFYLATIGQNGYPYVQHRGGPPGFLHVIDGRSLGFVDFSGNRQYISVGNLADRKEVALFLVSYPDRARLKIYAHARVLTPEEDPRLFARLDPASYPHRPERMIHFTVRAYDWNCPQHITPRYTQEEIKRAFAPQLDRLEELERENAALRQMNS